MFMSRTLPCLGTSTHWRRPLPRSRDLGDSLRVDAPVLEILMPIHARHLPNNSNSVLHAAVQPEARVDGTAPDGVPSAVGERRTIDPADELRPWDGPGRRAERDADVTTGPLYRREPWLVAQLLAFLPIIAAMFLPKAYQIPLFGLGGTLIAVGMVLLIRKELTGARSRSPSDSSSA